MVFISCQKFFSKAVTFVKISASCFSVLMNFNLISPFLNKSLRKWWISNALFSCDFVFFLSMEITKKYQNEWLYVINALVIDPVKSSLAIIYMPLNIHLADINLSLLKHFLKKVEFFRIFHFDELGNKID